MTNRPSCRLLASRNTADVSAILCSSLRGRANRRRCRRRRRRRHRLHHHCHHLKRHHLQRQMRTAAADSVTHSLRSLRSFTILFLDYLVRPTYLLTNPPTYLPTYHTYLLPIYHLSAFLSKPTTLGQTEERLPAITNSRLFLRTYFLYRSIDGSRLSFLPMALILSDHFKLLG